MRRSAALLGHRGEIGGHVLAALAELEVHPRPGRRVVEIGLEEFLRVLDVFVQKRRVPHQPGLARSDQVLAVSEAFEGSRLAADDAEKVRPRAPALGDLRVASDPRSQPAGRPNSKSDDDTSFRTLHLCP